VAAEAVSPGKIVVDPGFVVDSVDGGTLINRIARIDHVKVKIISLMSEL
jgi:hypothetical protein